ncbi:hypothetical protein PR048_028332 [Dryococelus australis]|uniref:Uncharacterized protein n=1 Tax=Dryococelus australis TaxID=614101 RepID=A0ABQ9GJ13_9NEOP|nr:hypothetical protein PR048_028332 [Dryococelus australis]
MVLVYGKARGNNHAERGTYQERRPTRRVPQHATLASVDRHLLERGSFTRANRQGRHLTVRTPDSRRTFYGGSGGIQRPAHVPLCTECDRVQQTAWRVLHDLQCSIYLPGMLHPRRIL